MAENKKGVIVYADWIKKFEALQDDEAGRLIKHFFRYINDQKPVEPDRMTGLLFIDIETTLKRDLKLWEKRAERSRENGKKGGRPELKEPTITQQVNLEPTKPDTVTVTGSVTVTVNDIYLKDLENSRAFETIQRQTGMTKEFLKSKIEPFKPCMKVEYKDFNEFADHFKNWTLKNKGTNQAKKLPKLLP